MKVDLHRFLATVPKSRCLAGVLYESMAQKIFQEDIELELVPLVKLDGHTKGDKLSQRHTSHQSLGTHKLDGSR